MQNVRFSNKFIRTGGSVSFQERPVHPSDFTTEREYENFASIWSTGEESFFLKYPYWQEFADCFIMRRAVIQIDGMQKCLTATFQASELENYFSTGFIAPASLAIPGFDKSSIPSGKYQLKSLDFRDLGDTFSIIHVSYIQYGEWELVQVKDTLPDPAWRKA